MLHDNIEFYSDEQIIEWLKVYNANLDAEFLPDVGFSVWEVQREYLRRCNVEAESRACWEEEL